MIECAECRRHKLPAIHFYRLDAANFRNMSGEVEAEFPKFIAKCKHHPIKKYHLKFWEPISKEEYVIGLVMYD